MRVLMTTDAVGGVWAYTAELTAELLRSGTAVALVIVGPGPSVAQQQWLRARCQEWPSAFQWYECAADLEWMTHNTQAYALAAPLLLQVARDFKADLLHANQFCFGALPLRIPKVVVAHSDVLSWSLACRGAAMEACPWLDVYTSLVSKGLASATAVVAPTRWMLQAVCAQFQFDCQTHVISNGRSAQIAGPPPQRKLQAITAGRLWDEAKNLKILARVQAPLPVMVAGDTTYQHQEAGVLNNVTMLGPLPEDALMDAFRQSSVYLCTSLYEPFGLAPLEAALCGCAVVANDIPSLREVWGRGATYFHDAASLQTALTALVQSREDLMLAQKRSAAQACKYTAHSMAREYRALYQALVTRHEEGAYVS